MTAIKFKITEITNQDLNHGPIAIKIEEINFPTGKGDEKTEITTLNFGGDKIEEIKDTFETGKSYQMEFNEAEVEDDRTLNHTFSCSMAGGPEPVLPNKLFIQEEKVLRVMYHKHNDSIKLTEETGTPTDPGTPKPTPTDPGTPKPTPTDPGTPKKPDSPDNPTPDKNPEVPQPPKNPEPTSQQVNEAINKLNQAKNSGNLESIKNALKEVSDIAKNSSDANLKKAKEEAERKLGEVGSNEEIRQIIREEIQKVLSENGITPTDLSPTVKQKLDELNNNNNNNNNNIEASQAQDIRTEVCKEAGIKTLEKLLLAVKTALESKDKKQIENRAKELQAFVDSNVDYKKHAYRINKVKVDQYLAEAKQQSAQNQNNEENFFRPNNPVMWVSGVAIIGFLVGIVWVVRARGKKQH